MATARRVGGEVASTARTQKRARDSLDGKMAGGRDGGFATSVVPIAAHTPGQWCLQERMKVELEAVRDLHRKAVLLCGRRGAAPAAKGDARLSADGLRREVPSEAAPSKRSKMFPTTKPATTAVAHQKPPSQRAAAAPPLPERKIEKTKEEVEERRRQMEALAREREEGCRLLLAMEMAALPDETVYKHELEELGIAPYEYAVTRTRSQALSQDRILVVAAY
ncbi:unnamed protein product [Urochloa humidicola]